MATKRHKGAGRGRPTKYDPKLHPVLAKWMARSGLTDEEIARELGIAVSTLNRWKQIYPEFSEALKANKALVDSQVEDSLLKRALGYEYEEVKLVMSDDGKRTKRVEKTIKQVVPDVTAAIFWLKNRQPQRWRDKQNVELTGKDGGPVEVADVREELARRIAGIATRLREAEAASEADAS